MLTNMPARNAVLDSVMEDGIMEKQKGKIITQNTCHAGAETKKINGFILISDRYCTDYRSSQ